MRNHPHRALSEAPPDAEEAADQKPHLQNERYQRVLFGRKGLGRPVPLVSLDDQT